MLSRSNVAYDLEISPHKLEVEYDGQTLVYVFSSDLYKRKFVEKKEENRNKISESLSKRFGFTIKNEILSDLKLYSTIEKRGFLLLRGCEKITCLNNIILDGGQMIKRNFKE